MQIINQRRAGGSFAADFSSLAMTGIIGVMVKSTDTTMPPSDDPRAVIEAIEHTTRRSDGLALLDRFSSLTGMAPRMWGPSIIGYGRYAYVYDSGRAGESMMTGFSPRKSSLSIYVMPGYHGEAMQERLARLGKHKMGKACLYVNKLADINLDVLDEIVLAGLDTLRDRYETFDA